MALNLCQFSNIHKNKLGFLIGSGPSLRHIRQELLSPYVTMTVNSSIVYKRDCDYFVSDDWAISNWSYFVRDLASSECIKFLYEKKFVGRVFHIKQHQICMFDHTWYFEPKTNKYNMNGLVLSQDCSKPIIGARTSLASGLHIMNIMGCNPVILIGCDGKMEGEKRYFWEYPGWPKPVRLDRRHDFPANIKSQIGNKECSEIREYWKLFGTMNKKMDFKVINSSRQSAIEVFDQIDFDKVLELYGDLKK